MTVDGFIVGDVQGAVVRDREVLSKDGIFAAIVSVDPKTGKLRKSQDIISRGLIYLRESQDFLREARFVIKNAVEADSDVRRRFVEIESIKEGISMSLSKFIFQKIAKCPIIIPVVFVA